MLNDATELVFNAHAQTVTSAASTLIVANSERSGLNVQLDPGATAATVVYLLLASAGTPGPTNYDVAITPSLSWDGMVGPVVWRGAVRALASAVGPFNITAVETL